MVQHSFDNGEFAETVTVVSQGQNVIKACLFNLIVIAEDHESGLHCQELVRIITSKFPCQIIFVRADKTAQSDFLQITRSVLTVGVGTSIVYCDQIMIEASPNQFQKIPFLIYPQIVPDLPVYLLLGQDPTQDSVILPQLQKYATRVIHDPLGIDNYQQFSERMLSAIQRDTRVDFIDINWARIRPWREVVSRVFSHQRKSGAAF